MHQNLVIFIIILISLVSITTTFLLLVPPTAPTRHQLLWGVGIPLPTTIAVTTGYVLKAQYYLADHVSDLYLKHDTWADITNVTPGTLRGFNGRKREIRIDPYTNRTYERYDEEIKEDIEYENYDLEEQSKKHQDVMKRIVDYRETFFGKSSEHGVNRWHIYYTIEQLLRERGFDGKACVLRMICEFAHAPITYYSGLLGELAYILLT